MPYNFVIKLSADAYADIKNTTDSILLPVLTDPEFQFDDGATTVRFSGELRDLGTNHARRKLRQVLGMVDPETALTKYATAAYKQQMKQELANARNALRNVAPPLNGPAPQPAPPLDPQDTAVAAMEKLATSDGGLVVGYDHAEPTSKVMLTNLIQSAGASGKIKHVFLEELPIELQQDVDNYLASPVGDMSPALAEHIQQKGMNADFRPMLEAARLNGVKLHGIDSVKADPGVANNDPRYHERRLVIMNAVVKDVYDRVRQQYPGEPFVALTGGDHVHTARGGIPGLCQIMGKRGVSVDAESNRVAEAFEDPSRRGAPSVAEAEFVDVFLAKAQASYGKYVADYRASDAFKNARPQPVVTEAMNGKHMAVIARDLAKAHTQAGKLPSAAAAAGLLTDPVTTAGLKKAFETTIGRQQREADMAAAIVDGKLDVLKKSLDDDPYLMDYRSDANWESGLLHTAALGGHAEIIDELCKRGFDPNATDLRGDTPLLRVLRGIGTKKPEDLAPGVAALLANGANPNKANSSGRTAVQLATDGPKGGFAMAETFADAGALSLDKLFIARFTDFVTRSFARAKESAQKRDKDNPALGGRVPEYGTLDKAEVGRAAQALYAKLGGATALNTKDTVKAAFESKPFYDETARLIRLALARAGNRDKLAAAIAGKKMDEVRTLLDADPTLAEINIDVANERTALALAVLNDDKALFRELTKVRKVDPNQKDTRGRTALHVLLSQEGVGKSGDAALAKHKVIANNVRRLVASGADVNAQNNGGDTALHLAGFMNNVDALGVLARRKADPTIRNKQGWTAADTALAATNKEAEGAFYKLKLSKPKPPLQSGTFSSVDLLCQATLCEKPEDIDRVRRSYEKLYADPSIRKVLDLAAKATANDRNPPDGGLRLFASQTNTVGRFYSAQTGPSGAYDEKVNTLLFPMAADNKEKDPAGTLAHELTHLAAHLATGDQETLPWTTDAEKREYLQAIRSDLDKLHLLDDNNEVEAFIKNRFSSRMGDYAEKTVSPGVKVKRTGEEYDEALLQEYLVGVPQVAAVYGMEYVEKHVPSLASYYKKFADRCEQIGNTDQRFQAGRAKTSTAANAALVTKATKFNPPTVAPDTMGGDSKSFGVDALLGKIRTGVTVADGVLDMNADGRTIAFKAEDFKLSDPDKAKLDKKLSAIRSTLEKTISATTLPPDKIPADLYRDLITSLTGSVRDLEGDDLKKAVVNQARTWVKSAKVASVEKKIGERVKPDTTDLAAVIIYRAEAKARGNAQLDIGDASEVDEKKQSELIAKLAVTLQKPEYASKLADPAKLISTMSSALAAQQNGAFYQKRPGSQPQHVSIDKQGARRIWLDKLATMN